VDVTLMTVVGGGLSILLAVAALVAVFLKPKEAADGPPGRTGTSYAGGPWIFEEIADEEAAGGGPA
jgi:hypothetical protein